MNGIIKINLNDKMNTDEAIKFLEEYISNPRVGLPHNIFLFISRITPLVNVDLLIKDEKGRVLLAWRDDKLQPPGWHIPGGIVRFKEKLEERIQLVAETEIGMPVKFDPIPLAMTQIISDKNTRGHFISLLYNCFLSSKYPLKNSKLKERDKGYLKWHDSCPTNLIKVHEMYKKFIQGDSNDY
jgi:ADP-ribose pyrophosphatase YjhB (NUDIX family)